MKFHAWMIVAALAIPVAAHAQRGGGGRGSAAGIDDQAPAPDNGIKAKDVLKQNPASLLIAKAKDLKLDDAEKTRLTDIGKRFDWNANVFSRQADSLQTIVDSRRSSSRGRRGGSGGASSDSVHSPDEILAARKALQVTLLNIRAEYDTAAARSLTALTDAQRAKGNSLLEKPSKDLADILRKAGGP